MLGPALAAKVQRQVRGLAAALLARLPDLPLLGGRDGGRSGQDMLALGTRLISLQRFEAGSGETHSDNVLGLVLGIREVTVGHAV